MAAGGEKNSKCIDELELHAHKNAKTTKNKTDNGFKSSLKNGSFCLVWFFNPRADSLNQLFEKEAQPVTFLRSCRSETKINRTEIMLSIFDTTFGTKQPRNRLLKD